MFLEPVGTALGVVKLIWDVFAVHDGDIRVLSVSFVDKREGSLVVWSWDFGHGFGRSGIRAGAVCRIDGVFGRDR